MGGCQKGVSIIFEFLVSFWGVGGGEEKGQNGRNENKKVHEMGMEATTTVML